MQTRCFYPLVWLLLTIITTAVKADGWGGSSWREGREHRAYEDRSYDYSLDRVVSDLQRRREGRVLSAETIDEDGHSVHRIRIISDKGLVRGLRFDGATGRLLPHFDHHSYLDHSNQYKNQHYPYADSPRFYRNHR